MGCSISKAKQYHRRTHGPISLDDNLGEKEPEETPVIIRDPIEVLKSDFQTVVQGVSKLPKQVQVKPMVCLSEKSIPLVLASMSLNPGGNANVHLPVVAMSRELEGRIAVFGSIDILLDSKADVTEASVFFESLIRWISKINRISVKVCLFGLSEAQNTVLMKNMDGFGFSVKTEQTPFDISKTHCIICLSDCLESSFLEEFVSNGGGLIVCAQNESHILQPLLLKAGIPFANCPLQYPHSEEIRVPRSFNVAHEITLNSLVTKYKGLLQSDSPNPTDLDNAVTSLRYHIMMLDNEKRIITKELLNESKEFLSRTNFSKDGLICSLLTHAIVVVLISEMVAKLHPKCFYELDLSDPFPGTQNSQIIDNFSIKVPPQGEGWYSTGLWLPAGVLGTITVDRMVPGLGIQVGSQTECILSKPGPWRRWPTATMFFNVVSLTTEIASPLGGIIYLVFDIECQTDLNVKLSNVQKYSLIQLSEIIKPDLSIPFCEIVAPNCIFTIPSNDADGINDISEFIYYYNSLISNTLKFIASTNQRQTRVVFDIELPEDGSICGYPITLGYESIEPILHLREPNQELFTLLMYIALLNIPENVFNEQNETLFSILAACSVFLQMWPSCSPLEYTNALLPEHFNEMWTYFTKARKDAIPAIITRVSMKKQSFPTDDLSRFLTDLSKEFKVDLSFLGGGKSQEIEKKGQLYLNSSESLQSFQINEIDLI